MEELIRLYAAAKIDKEICNELGKEFNLKESLEHNELLLEKLRYECG